MPWDHRPRFFEIFSVLLLAALTSCASSGRPIPEIAEEINATLRRVPVTVQPGDVLSLTFDVNTDWNHETEVRPDGRASFFLIDELRVGGLTISAIDELVTQRYRSELQRGEAETVTVDIKSDGGGDSSPDREVVVMGDVTAPGAVRIGNSRLTLVEAIGKAGGPLKPTALLQYTLLVRYLPEEKAYHAWRIDASVEHWGQGMPIFLQPHDVVFVPNTPIDDANIWVDQWIRRMLPFPFFFPA